MPAQYQAGQGSIIADGIRGLHLMAMLWLVVWITTAPAAPAAMPVQPPAASEQQAERDIFGDIAQRSIPGDLRERVDRVAERYLHDHVESGKATLVYSKDAKARFLAPKDSASVEL